MATIKNQLEHTRPRTHATSAIGFHFRFIFSNLLCHNTGISAVWVRARDAVNTLLFSRPRRASQFPFISCLAPRLHATCILLLFKKCLLARLVLPGLSAAHDSSAPIILPH